VVVLSPPQAARDRTIASAMIIAMNFFIMNFSLLILGQTCPDLAANAVCKPPKIQGILLVLF
jgi:hypothetical protein